MSASADGVTAEQLVRSLRRRNVTLPAEIGTFVALETCEELVRRGPCELSLSAMRISEEGRIEVERKPGSDEESCARALHRDLTTLLVTAGPAPAPQLMRLVEHGPRGGRWTLAQLKDDLEASLVPLNRNASRRVLARLVREVARDRPSTRPSQPPTFRELDTQLSSFLGVEDLGPSPAELAAQQRARERDKTIQDAVEEVDISRGEVSFFDAEDSSGEDTRVLPSESRGAWQGAQSTERPAAPVSSLQGGASDSLLPRRRQQARGLWTAGLLVALALALLGITYIVRPDVFDRSRGVSSAPRTPPSPRAPALPKAGDLVVRVSPERAQVLRLVGKGPVTVPHIPVGVAIEFVALAEGFAPTRAVVPADAEWERDGSDLRYELAMQLGTKLPEGAVAELGETQLPADIGTPRGSRGSVRIVTTPRGADVYVLVGFAPEARIENLPIDATQEILVYRKGFAAESRAISTADFASPGQRPTAEVSVRLKPLERSNR
jgi:hypothetical protein